ncbi:hypothetical protein LFYK43_16990 [Ligilactobacillus salitolerans]|uniref:DoxX family protein n=1 Tax=Ligilactobacillus salitolerans TaxID=1808352 RepID=A0A401IUL3_9LACO|nr:DoxX family membrane protein [Ligilactobacillus salitolerans]GBG95240.1 hypothetical protein LFYK43_16990 [Ligilactobacillus salitolerans]
MVKWLRNSTSGMWVMTIVRLYLGYQWLMDGFEKVSGGFSAKGFVANAIAHPVVGPTGSQSFPGYTPFLKSFVMPNINLFSFVVSWGELLVGLGLLLGTLTTAAAFFGVVMNFCYLMAGTVSVNPTYVLLGFLIMIAGFNAGKIGLDRWVVPFLREKMPWLKRSVEK